MSDYEVNFLASMGFVVLLVFLLVLMRPVFKRERSKLEDARLPKDLDSLPDISKIPLDPKFVAKIQNPKNILEFSPKQTRSKPDRFSTGNFDFPNNAENSEPNPRFDIGNNDDKFVS